MIGKKFVFNAFNLSIYGLPKMMKNRVTPKYLKFREGKFHLVKTISTNQRAMLRHSSRWEKTGPDSFRTGHLGAARAFRQYGDEKCEKIFKKSFQSHYVLPKMPVLPGLDPHQREGIEWILSRKRAYLAHAPGAGKTAEAILASCLSSGKGRTLFIVPPHLVRNWEREIWKFTEWLSIFPTVGIVRNKSFSEEETDWKADFVICPDSLLTRPDIYVRLLMMKSEGIKFLAVDEASRFKDPFAKRSLALYGGFDGDTSYQGLFRDARHVVLMDGSPMPNRPIELYAPTYALCPEAIDCMTYDDFGYRYCGAKPNERGVWEYLYSSNEEELRVKLRKDFMHVVTESELSHPERRRSMIVMSEDVRSVEQKSWERRHLGKFEKYFAGEKMSQGEAAHFRKDLGIRKAPWVASYVREKLEEKNESIIVFAWHRDVCEKLAKELSKYHPGVIMGGTKEPYRHHQVDLFQRGIIRLLILNISAAGRGLNLQKADRIIFAEFSWSDETNKQAEKRASRKGSIKEFVRSEYIVSPNSMDEIVLQSIFSKERRVKKVVG